MMEYGMIFSYASNVHVCVRKKRRSEKFRRLQTRDLKIVNLNVERLAMLPPGLRLAFHFIRGKDGDKFECKIDIQDFAKGRLDDFTLKNSCDAVSTIPLILLLIIVVGHVF